jgi:hypothetical protein
VTRPRAPLTHSAHKPHGDRVHQLRVCPRGKEVRTAEEVGYRPSVHPALRCPSPSAATLLPSAVHCGRPPPPHAIAAAVRPLLSALPRLALLRRTSLFYGRSGSQRHACSVRVRSCGTPGPRWCPRAPAVLHAGGARRRRTAALSCAMVVVDQLWGVHLRRHVRVVVGVQRDHVERRGLCRASRSPGVLCETHCGGCSRSWR